MKPQMIIIILESAIICGVLERATGQTVLFVLIAPFVFGMFLGLTGEFDKRRDKESKWNS